MCISSKGTLLAINRYPYDRVVVFSMVGDGGGPVYHSTVNTRGRVSTMAIADDGFLLVSLTLQNTLQCIDIATSECRGRLGIGPWPLTPIACNNHYAAVEREAGVHVYRRLLGGFFEAKASCGRPR